MADCAILEQRHLDALNDNRMLTETILDYAIINLLNNSFSPAALNGRICILTENAARTVL